MLRKIRHWFALQGWERRALIRFALLLPLTWLGLRVLGFNRMTRICMAGKLANNIGTHRLDRAQRHAVLMSIAARHGLYKANCLHQALPLCWFLRRRGSPAQLKIGVKPDLADFQAHAWVELDGVALGQQGIEYNAINALYFERQPLP